MDRRAMQRAHVDPERTFDVIIVGAGAAGCVLASRLSEVHDREVLLIEAGKDIAAPGSEHPDVLDPFCLAASANPTFHWPGLRVETHADTGISRSYVQGRGIGGASNINGMGADRGQPGDYDRWRELGAESWGWRDVQPYFKKLEHDLDFEHLDAAHGNCGPMPVRRLPRHKWAPFAAAMGEAVERRGCNYIDDYMSIFDDGLSAVPTNCLPEKRVSAAMAYLTHEVRNRPNLTILTDAQAEQLIFEDRCISGVRIQHAGARIFLRAREVTVTCGALHSPAVLLRSGIGPRRQLIALGIGVKRDLPGVGENLQNHPSIAVSAYLRAHAAQPAKNPWFLQNWARYSSRHPGCESSDMHLMIFNKGAWHALGARIGTVVVSVLNAHSKGSVRLTNPDASVPPRVQFNSLSAASDLERLVGGLRFALELLMDPRVQRIRHEIFVPDPRIVASLQRRTPWNRLIARAITAMLDIAALRPLLLATSRIDPAALLGDPNALERFVRTHAAVQYHVCGTCRMGRAEDKDAVVDADGRVHGVGGLRVADASIFPAVPRGYPHFIVIMAAEKISDAIKAEWRRNIQ